MTAPDLTAIVESVARAEYERKVAESGHGDCCKPWDESDPFMRAEMRESLLLTVTATLRALTPLVEEWEHLAQQNDDLGMRRAERDEDAYAQRAFGARDALRSAARQVRGIVS